MYRYFYKNESTAKWINIQMNQQPNESTAKWINSQMNQQPNESTAKWFNSQMNQQPKQCCRLYNSISILKKHFELVSSKNVQKIKIAQSAATNTNHKWQTSDCFYHRAFCKVTVSIIALSVKWLFLSSRFLYIESHRSTIIILFI